MTIGGEADMGLGTSYQENGRDFLFPSYERRRRALRDQEDLRIPPKSKVSTAHSCSGEIRKCKLLGMKAFFP